MNWMDIWVICEAVFSSRKRWCAECAKTAAGRSSTTPRSLPHNGVKDIPSSAPVAAQGGLNAITTSLAIELASDNIRVNAVAPGIVPTPLYGELNNDQRTALHAMQPLGRYGTVSDIADAVLYLADASWVTGVILPVDGGVAAGGDGKAGLAA